VWPADAGHFGLYKRVYLCSPMCTVHHQCRNKKPIRCEYCGKRFVPQTTGKHGRFCCRQHFDDWRRRQTDQEKFGPFAAMVTEFISAVIPGQRAPESEGWIGCEYVPAAGTSDGLGWLKKYASA
jgi:hypothetical protein